MFFSEQNTTMLATGSKGIQKDRLETAKGLYIEGLR